MEITRYMEENGHEALMIRVDKNTGLKAIMAIHDTTLGPAMGPPMMAHFPSETEAIRYALRFAYNHTWKCAMADLPYGGGRIVVIGDPVKDKTEVLVRSLGRFVDSLGGGYVLTGGGSGFTVRDTELFLKETKHIIGLPLILGGSDDHARMAGYGVYYGMKACAEEVYNSDSLAGRTISISGIGGVGSALAEYLFREGANLIVADPKQQVTDMAREKYNAKVVSAEDIFDVECDIFSPCSRAYLLNRETIQRLRCKIVAGAANNQLEDSRSGAKQLHQRGILHAPEFVINAGAMINFYAGLGGYKPELARRKTENIKTVLKTVFETAIQEEQTPTQAAYLLAKQKIQQARKMKRHSVYHADVGSGD